jgi:hypothetical protein
MTTARSDGSGIRFYRIQAGITLVGALGPGIEVVQRHHRYAMVSPSINPKVNAVYRWIDEQSGEVLEEPADIDDLPDLPWAWIDEFRSTRPDTPSGTVASLEEVDRVRRDTRRCLEARSARRCAQQARRSSARRVPP